MTEFNWKKLSNAFQSTIDHTNKTNRYVISAVNEFISYAIDEKTQTLLKADKQFKTTAEMKLKYNNNYFGAQFAYNFNTALALNGKLNGDIVEELKKQDKLKTIDGDIHTFRTILHSHSFQSSQSHMLNEGKIELHSFAFDKSSVVIDHVTKGFDNPNADLIQWSVNFHFVIYNDIKEIKISDLQNHINTLSYRAEKKSLYMPFFSTPSAHKVIFNQSSWRDHGDKSAVSGYFDPKSTAIQMQETGISLLHLTFSKDNINPESIKNKTLKTAIPVDIETQYSLTNIDNIFFIPKSLIQ